MLPANEKIMSALELVHAFHCIRPHGSCPDSVCAAAKEALRRVEAHALECPRRVHERDAADGTQAECKMCRLWAALHRTRLVSVARGIPPAAGASPSAETCDTAKCDGDSLAGHGVVGLQLRSGRMLQTARRTGQLAGVCDGEIAKPRRQLAPAQVRHAH